jgi:hypothetical protein
MIICATSGFGYAEEFIMDDDEIDFEALVRRTPPSCVKAVGVHHGDTEDTEEERWNTNFH